MMELTDVQQRIREQAQQVFRDVFENPALVVTDETTAADIPSWDSLTHINLVLALEQRFGIQFSSEEVTSMANVGDLFRLLERKR